MVAAILAPAALGPRSKGSVAVASRMKGPVGGAAIVVLLLQERATGVPSSAVDTHDAAWPPCHAWLSGRHAHVVRLPSNSAAVTLRFAPASKGAQQHVAVAIACGIENSTLRLGSMSTPS